MATPRSKEKILRCAREMFYHLGYHATSVDDIIFRTGVAKSNFYYHFKTKEQLALAVLETQIDEYELWIGQSLRNPMLRPTDRLQSFFAQLCSAQQEMQKMAGCPFGNFAATLPGEDEFAGEDKKQRERYEQSEMFRKHISRMFRHLELALHDCLAEGAACGEFRCDIAPEELASYLLATIEGLLILTKTHKDMAHMLGGFSVAQRLLCAR